MLANSNKTIKRYHIYSFIASE